MLNPNSTIDPTWSSPELGPKPNPNILSQAWVMLQLDPTQMTLWDPFFLLKSSTRPDQISQWVGFWSKIRTCRYNQIGLGQAGTSDATYLQSYT